MGDNVITWEPNWTLAIEKDCCATPKKDPWVHRSTGMKCITCMWFVSKKVDATRVVKIGRCRRHCPAMGGYPVVYPTDWCGDHRVDENTL